MNAPPPLRQRGRRMLVVDDESVITFAMHRYFTQQGFHVHCAAESEEALALLMDNEYDVIVADLRLTGTESEEGLEVVRHARDRSSDVCIIVLTAYGTPGLDSKALGAGADMLLQKPRPLPDLAQAVYILLEARE